MANSTYSELISLAEQIRTATAADSNTAELLGGTIKQLIQFVGTLSTDAAIQEGLEEIEAALEEAQSTVSGMETEIQTAVSEAQASVADAIADIETAKEQAIEDIEEHGGVEVVQETGDSTTAVMSQNAVKQLFDPAYVEEDISSQLVVAESGKIVNNSGIVSRTNGCYTNPISFQKGDLIRLTTSVTPSYLMYSNNLVVSTYNSDTGKYDRIYGEGSDPASLDFYYYCQDDIALTFSYHPYYSFSQLKLYRYRHPQLASIKEIPVPVIYGEYSTNSAPSVGSTFSLSSIGNVSGGYANYRRICVKCKEGEEYIVRNNGYINYNSKKSHKIMVCDADFKILWILSNPAVSYITDQYVKIPDGGVYLFAFWYNNYCTVGIKKLVRGEADETGYHNIHLENVIQGSTYPMSSPRGFSIPAVGSKMTYSAGNYNTGYPYAFDVVAGEEYLLTIGYMTSGCILDSNDYVIQLITASISDRLIVDEPLTIPEGGARIVINAYCFVDIKRKKDGYSLLPIGADTESIIKTMRQRPTSTSFSANYVRFALSWISDTHGDMDAYNRFVDFSNRYRGNFDAVLHTGDANRMSDTDRGYAKTVGALVPDIPMFYAIGNHDAHGQSYNTPALVSGSTAWNGENYCAPLFTSSTVYSTDKCNYYQDFSTPKIRLIVLNDYDMPRWVNTNNWQTTTDADEIASAVDWVKGTSYAVGNIVNYKGLYLKCKVAGVINDNGTDWNNNATIPRGPYNVACVYWQQPKIDFFLSALNVSSGWSIIICSHNPMELLPSDSSLVVEKWTYLHNSSAKAIDVKFGQNGYILQDILSAYLNKTTINNTYKAITPKDDPLTGTLINQTDYLPDVTVSANFSSAAGDIICYLHGHQHCDSAFYSNHMSGGKKLLSVGNTIGCFRPTDIAQTWFSGDIIKGNTVRDCYNVISFDTTEKAVYILRVGANMTDQLTKRDYIRISYAHN